LILVSEVARGDQTLEKAIDHGGPSREFIHQLWKQMGRLKVCYKENGTSLSLFTEEKGGLLPRLLPQKNEIVDATIERMVKEAKSDKSPVKKQHIRNEMKVKMKAMYRAIGRIMARCMFHLDQRPPDHVEDDVHHKFLISAKALPVFYRNCKSQTLRQWMWSRFELRLTLWSLKFSFVGLHQIPVIMTTCTV
jgi:hypothetical protein